MNPHFSTTHWTQVRQATGHSEGGKQALSELCEAYYAPVVAYLQQHFSQPDQARDAAHDFFAKILAQPALHGADPGRGKFRHYLLGALKHHLLQQHEAACRQKRGGGIAPISLEANAAIGAEAADHLTLPPDREFDRQWARHILHTATEALKQEWDALSRAEEFEWLYPFIIGDTAHGDLAMQCQDRVQNPATVRKNLSRLRQRFREFVRATIAGTLAEPTDVAEEMRYFVAVLSG
jgi:DNA-directed RNA polymerase specialized sigma24 family protein